MRTRTWTDEQLIDAVKESLSISQVLSRLGLVVAGGNYKSINGHVKRLKLDTGHFTGQTWNRGVKHAPYKYARPLSEILVEHSTFSTSHLKKRLFKDGVFEEKCYRCNRIEWEGEPIPLELDHRNGVNTDHRIENLNVLCPNCHALTPTYRGRNIQAAVSQPAEEAHLK